jgi:hypothetical protein
MTDSLFSWSTLMTLSGAAMITFLIVLYTGRFIDEWVCWEDPVPDTNLSSY